MDLDQKIDYLTDNIITLAGQTEKRAKNAELLISQAFQELNTATTDLNRSADTIKQTAAEEVHRGLNQSVDKFTERMETSGRWLLENSREIEKQQQQSAKNLKYLVIASITLFCLTALLCLGTIVYSIQLANTQIKRIEWVEEINKAIDNGKLMRCGEDGGICTRIKGKSIRLDQ